jgi:hypothetical protein
VQGSSPDAWNVTKSTRGVVSGTAVSPPGGAVASADGGASLLQPQITSPMSVANGAVAFRFRFRFLVISSSCIVSL